MEERLEVATVGEEVATTGEAIETVDLSVVSQQLDQVIAWQCGQFLALWVLAGCIIGAMVGKALGRAWR